MRMTMYLSSDDADYETHPTLSVKRDDDGDFYVVVTDCDGTEFSLCMTAQQYADFTKYVSRARPIPLSTKLGAVELLAKKEATVS